MTALYNAFHCYATSNVVVVVVEEHFWPLFAPSFFIQLGFVRTRKKIKGYSAQKIGFSPPPFIIDHFIKKFGLTKPRLFCIESSGRGTLVHQKILPSIYL